MVDVMRQQIAEENQAADESDLTHPDPAHEIGCLKVFHDNTVPEI